MRSITSQVAHAYLEHWRVILLAGLAVFIPLGGIEVLDHLAQEPLADESLEVDSGFLLALGAAVVAHATAALLGEVLYAGIIAAAVNAARHGRRPSTRELLAHIPFWRLVAVDLLWVVVVAVGLIAFVVPGIVFIGWFALVAPAVELEDRRPMDAFRRSRELVRRRFWFVLGLVLPIIVVADLLGTAAESASLWGLGDGVIGDWVGSILANLISSPPYALLAVFLFVGLRDYRRIAQAASR